MPMKTTVFWDVTFHSVRKIYQYFRETCHLHDHERWRWLQVPPKQQSISIRLHSVISKGRVIIIFTNVRMSDHNNSLVYTIKQEYDWYFW